ncbi:MAG TPA: glycosyltransferase family 2 protein, partial [Prolixibacteraceae bacterium]|nr:glycosyltransferase family 2 protein [Prolixibacteraceae bacterium]
MSHPEKIYCIVVTYNAENWIEKCLNSVLQSTVACIVLVLDNKSEDRTPEIIKNQYPQVTFIQNNENLGFGKANNKAIQLAYDAGADYFFLLNQDACVEHQTIEYLVEKLRQHPEYGILSPLQYYNSEKLDRKFKSYLKGMDENSIQKLSAEERDFVVEVRFVNAALWLMSRRCIETVGLFAPIFDHYGEDQNYAHRCKFHQLKMGVYLKATGYHEREQLPIREKNTSVKKLLVRDKHLCLTILMNLKHSYSRQWLF